MVCKWRLSIHGRTVAWKGIAVLSAASSQEISWYSGLDYAGCPGFISSFKGELPFSFQKPSAVNSSLSETGEKSLLLLYLLSDLQGTNLFCEATRKQGQMPSGWKRDSAGGKPMCSLVSVSHGRNLVIRETQQHIHPSWLGHGAGKTKWKTQPTAERTAETIWPVQPSLIPAQGSNLIKCQLNPWIFCLGDE